MHSHTHPRMQIQNLRPGCTTATKRELIPFKDMQLWGDTCF